MDPTTGAAPRIRFNENTFDANGLLLVLGGHTRLSDRWSVAYSLRTPPVVFSGTGTFADISRDGAQDVRESFSLGRMSVPWRLSGGLAYGSSPWTLWALDLHLCGGYEFNPSPSA